MKIANYQRDSYDLREALRGHTRAESCLRLKQRQVAYLDALCMISESGDEKVEDGSCLIESVFKVVFMKVSLR